MREFTSLVQFPDAFRGAALSIGNFDGVHQGHAAIIRRVVAMAQRWCGPSILFTFDPHPVRLLRPQQAPPPLTWTRRKAMLVAELGIDALVAYPTDLALLNLNAREFFQRVVIEQLAARGLVEGANFYFGQGREGNIDLLAQLCSDHGIEFERVEPLQFAGSPVSSSRIRQVLGAGDVELAAQMLTRPYRVRGIVTHGTQRGREIGFPTANLAGIDTLIPGPGVYAGRATLAGQSFAAAIHVGPSPTFEQLTHRVEVHLLGFDQSIYGEPLEVDFLYRLRDIVKFPDVVELQRQLKADLEQVRARCPSEINKE